LEQRDRFFDALLRDDMRKLNSHLPKNRRTLKELLSDPAPKVPAASGDPIKMKKDELEELSRSLPAEADTRVKLPIVLLRRIGTKSMQCCCWLDPSTEVSKSTENRNLT